LELTTDRNPQTAESVNALQTATAYNRDRSLLHIALGLVTALLVASVQLMGLVELPVTLETTIIVLGTAAASFLRTEVE
jgi:hypothetical protein